MYINRIAPTGTTSAASLSWLDRIAVSVGAFSSPKHYRIPVLNRTVPR